MDFNKMHEKHSINLYQQLQLNATRESHLPQLIYPDVSSPSMSPNILPIPTLSSFSDALNDPAPHPKYAEHIEDLGAPMNSFSIGNTCLYLSSSPTPQVIIALNSVTWIVVL